MPRKHEYDYVKKVFEDRGCVLLSTEYKNSITKLDYICICGERTTTRFANFKKGHSCAKCGGVATSEKQRFSLEKVTAIFSDAGCQLLSPTYENNMQVLDYKCNCGRESRTSLANFQRGVRCIECGMNKLRGANNPKWNPNKEANTRNTPEYRKWRNDVLKRDEYTCQRCGDLHWAMTAHHVQSFKTALDVRYDVDNGITLCRKCHTEFHVAFKFNDNDGSQLMQFLLDRDETNPWYAGEIFD